MSSFLHVLHIDDEPAILDTVKLVVANESKGQIIVDQAINLAEARQALINRAYDIMLIDLGLDDSKGIETIEALKVYGIPMVVFSGINETEMLIAVANVGVEDYIVKPAVTSANLVNRLRFAHTRYMRRIEGEKQWELMGSTMARRKTAFDNVALEALKPFISCPRTVSACGATFAGV